MVVESWIRAQCWEGTQLQDPMPSKAETQVGEVLEAELADDKRRDFALGPPAGRLNLELGSHPGAPEQPVPDRSPVGFALSGMIPVTAYAGAAILVFVLYYVAWVALMLQTLTRVPAQVAKRVDVAQGDTPKRPAGEFQPVVPRR